MTDITYEQLKEEHDKREASQLKRLATIKQRYGSSFFSDIAKEPHRRGFDNQDTQAKAQATRRKNAQIQNND